MIFSRSQLSQLQALGNFENCIICNLLISARLEEKYKKWYTFHLAANYFHTSLAVPWIHDKSSAKYRKSMEQLQHRRSAKFYFHVSFFSVSLMWIMYGMWTEHKVEFVVSTIFCYYRFCFKAFCRVSLRNSFKICYGAIIIYWNEWLNNYACWTEFGHHGMTVSVLR